MQAPDHFDKLRLQPGKAGSDLARVSQRREGKEEKTLLLMVVPSLQMGPSESKLLPHARELSSSSDPINWGGAGAQSTLRSGKYGQRLAHDRRNLASKLESRTFENIREKSSNHETSLNVSQTIYIGTLL